MVKSERELEAMEAPPAQKVALRTMRQTAVAALDDEGIEKSVSRAAAGEYSRKLHLGLKQD